MNTDALRLFFSFSSLLISISALSSGIMVLRANPKPKSNKFYFFLCLAVSFWSFFHFLWLYKFYGSYSEALLLSRLLDFGAYWIPILGFCFIIYFLGEENIFHIRILMYFGWGLTFIFVLFSFTHLLIPTVKEILPGIYWPQIGPLYTLFLGVYIIFPGYAVIRLIKKYFSLTSYIKRRQIGILIIGSFLGFGGGFTNYPQWFGIKMWPWGHPLVILYVILFTYGIIRYHLFGVETVIHKTLLYILISSLVFTPLALFIYWTQDFLRNLSWYNLALLSTLFFFIFKAFYDKVQPQIAHIFRRRKYDYQFLLQQIPQNISGILNIDALSDRLLTLLKETLYPQNIALILKDLKDPQKYTLQYLKGYPPHFTSSLQNFSLSTSSPLIQYLNTTPTQVLEKEIIEIDPHYSSIKPYLEQIFNTLNIILLLPLKLPQQNQLIGLLGLGKRETLKYYTHQDKHLLHTLSFSFASCIDNALNHTQILSQQKTLQEIKLAQKLQQSLLPPSTHPSSFKDYLVWGILLPAREIGGDYYDFIYQEEKDILNIVIGDVSGKGLDAGIVSVMVKSTLWVLSSHSLSPQQILNNLNYFLYQHLHQQKFVSLLYFSLFLNQNKIIYSSAGHEHILIYRTSTSQIEVIKSGGLILGMFPQIDQYLKETSLTLNPGDKILLYTDGAIESKNREGKMFGLNNLINSFKKHASLPLKEHMQQILQDIRNFSSVREQYDDITLVGVERVK